MNYIIIDQVALFHITGIDSERYLNSRLTNNIKVLDSLCSVQAAMLSPQGKTQALFSVLRITNNEFKLVCPTSDSNSIIKAVKQFLVSEQVVVDDHSDQYCIIKIFKDSFLNFSPTENNKLKITDKIISYRSDSTLSPELNLIVPLSQKQQIVSDLASANATQLSENDYLTYRIKTSSICFEKELANNSLLAKINLEKLVSFHKGCYIGQEVIEKLTTRGKSPTKIISIKLETSTKLSPADVVTDREGKKIGNIITCSKENGFSYCFAEIKTSALDDDIFCEQQRATIIF